VLCVCVCVRRRRRAGGDSGWFPESATVDATGVAGGGEGVLRVSRYRKWLPGSHWLLGARRSRRVGR